MVKSERRPAAVIQGSSSIAETIVHPCTPASATERTKPAAENPQQKTRRTQPSVHTEMPTTKQNAERAQQRADPDQRVTELRLNSLANQVTAKGSESHRWQPARLQLELSTTDIHR